MSTYCWAYRKEKLRLRQLAATPAARPSQGDQVALNEIVDTTKVRSVPILDKKRFETYFANFKKLMHREPTPTEEPTMQQLTAYEELLRCNTIYSDAAIFGANQQRTAKAVIGRGRIVGSKGTLIMTDFKGPRDYPT